MSAFLVPYILAGGPITHATSPGNQDQILFSHNPAAWIGVILCIFLLNLWFKEDAKRKTQELDGQDDQ